ncbi:MAG: hypothetical protein R3F54_05180 [Alphaproteobacteria bacterium]
MGSPGGGVGGAGSSGSSGGGVGGSAGGGQGGGNDGGSAGASGSDRDSSSDRSDSRSDTGQTGMTGSERTAGSEAFDGAMNEAAGQTDDDDDSDDRGTAGTQSADGQSGNGTVDGDGDSLGGLSGPSAVDTDGTEEDAAQAAAEQNQHANEFDGLGPTSAPVDNSMPGPDSFNSHRGYGPDESMAEGIDQDVNTALESAPETEKGPEEDKAARDTDATDLVGPAGYGAAGLQGGLEAYGAHVDRTARANAANTLTKGNAANLPGRTDLARAITDPRMTASKALDATPYSAKAASTQQLAAGAKAASTVGRLASGVGLGVQPAAGAIQGYVNTPEDASWTDRATNTLVGAVKEIDDTGVAYGAGALAAAGTVAASPAAGPAAPAVAVSAPAVGVGAAVYAGEQWNNSPADQFFDRMVEDYMRPSAQFAFEAIDSYVVDPVSGLVDRVFGDEEADAAAED